MHWLELKIPPLLVFAIAAILEWLSPLVLPEIASGSGLARAIVATVCVVASVVLIAAAVLEFRRSQTTVDPTSPDKASSIVESGVYNFSRNPMYLAMVLMLLALGIYLWRVGGIFVIAGFIAYITRFQIIPEERILANKFEENFKAYRRRVRRWI